MNYNLNKAQIQQQPMNQQQGNFPQNVANFGAHEILMTHEVLSDTINCINIFEMLRSHVQDQQLARILDNQMNFTLQGYNTLVNYLHNSGGSRAVPYQTPKVNNIKYGLRNPSPESPNINPNQINDMDIATAMLSCAKSSASWKTVAALECADPTLHELMTNCVTSSINMAYETFQYMNQKGYYQVATLQENTTQTIIDTYQPATSTNQISYM